MKLKVINGGLTVCQVQNYSQVDMTQPYTFAETTDEEKSLVCLTVNTPTNTIKRDDGWRAFRIQGPLDFALIGILAKIASLLADQQISTFAVSTYNTDYVLVRHDKFAQALDVLSAHGYEIEKIGWHTNSKPG